MTSSSATASAYPMWMIQKHAKALRYCIYIQYIFIYIYITSHRKWYVSIHGQGRSWLVVVEVVDVVMATNMSTRWIIVTHNTHKTPYFFHPPGCHLHSSCDFCRIISHQKREMNSFHPNCTLCCSRFVFYIYVYVVLYRYITGEISICLPVYTWYDQTIKERNHATWLTSKENNHTGFGGFVSEPSAPFVSFQTSLLWFHLSPVLSAVQFLHSIGMQHWCEGLGLHLAMVAPMSNQTGSWGWLKKKHAKILVMFAHPDINIIYFQIFSTWYLGTFNLCGSMKIQYPLLSYLEIHPQYVILRLFLGHRKQRVPSWS